MNNFAKSNGNPLRVEGKTKKPSWNQITKAANKLARKKTSPQAIANKVDNKLSNHLSYFEKNIRLRDRVKIASYFCALVSLAAGCLGVYTFVNLNNAMSILLGVVLFSLIGLNEYLFRKYADKYADELFIFKNWLNPHLPKFVFFSLVTIVISSGGYYKWNLEHHAPDPTLLAAKAEIEEKKKELSNKQADYDQLVFQSTVRDGKDKGRIQFQLESSVNAATENLEAFKKTIAELENKIRGKKVLDLNYQNKVLYDSLLGAFILFLFAMAYTGCMFYMSYFDYRHYAETYPSKYLAHVAKRNQVEENF